MDKLDFVTREIAVVDGVMANGLVDNGQFKLGLAYVLDVLKEREQVSARAFVFCYHVLEIAVWFSSPILWRLPSVE